MPQEVDPSRRRPSNTVTPDKRSGNGKGEDRSGRPWVWYLHSLFGLKLSLFLLFVSATGTAAVVSDEIEWLVYPEARATTSSARASWETQYHAAVRAFPFHTLTYMEAGEEPFLATRISATAPDGTSRVIFIDPATGRVTGERGWVTVRSFLRALHYLLFAPDDWGFFPVTILGFVLLVSLVTGMRVIKKPGHSAGRWPRRYKGPRVFWGDVHRLIGVWSSWFVLVMAVTSIWYFAERLAWRAGIDWEAPRTTLSAAEWQHLAEERAALERLPLDQLVRKAQQAFPGLNVRQISLPADVNETIVFQGQTGAWLVRDRTNSVELNPYTGDVIAVNRAEAMSWLERWEHTADPLHFGDFGGLTSKLVWVGFGIILCLLSLSGTIVYIRRLAKGPGAPAGSRRQVEGPTGLYAYLETMGRWKWINLFLVTLVPIACFIFFWNL
ncbi:PepSY-associated TM helix domain-containing protein [Nitrospina watsonii]|uniref:PepSY domain-containing protein n=1 Tax=Nitrospina watsonii TaxID=1323948 RepID=A0ABM9HEZ4_9BACT|nr:PepSY-associated TM helix domain-containing protein [Nitrospina watsonii]CAI2718812.1 membrane protein of unknown function [Nitrospina watsonii]